MIAASHRCPVVDDCLIDLFDNARLAVAVSQRHAMNNPTLPESMIYCFADSEHIYRYPVSMIIRKDNPMLDAINEHIQWAVEGGLLVKWFKDIQATFNRAIDENLGPKKLAIENISAALFGYALFGMFAVCAFIAEHIVHRAARRSGAGRFWKIADMLIDGDRHFLHHVSPARMRPARLRKRQKITLRNAGRGFFKLFKRQHRY